MPREPRSKTSLPTRLSPISPAGGSIQLHDYGALMFVRCKTMKKQNVLFSLSALLAIGLAAMPALANSAPGTLAGEVTDPSGSVVANAKVVISRGAFSETVLT